MKELDQIVDENLRIYEEDYFYIYTLHPNKFIDTKILKWHKEDFYDYTTLKDIRNAIPKGVVMVVVDSGLNGYIYEIGNYPSEDKWRVYAKTKGYA